MLELLTVLHIFFEESLDVSRWLLVLPKQHGVRKRHISWFQLYDNSHPGAHAFIAVDKLFRLSSFRTNFTFRLDDRKCDRRHLPIRRCSDSWCRCAIIRGKGGFS